MFECNHIACERIPKWGYRTIKINEPNALGFAVVRFVGLRACFFFCFFVLSFSASSLFNYEIFFPVIAHYSPYSLLVGSGRGMGGGKGKDVAHAD